MTKKVNSTANSNKQVDELKNQLARSLADYDNLRKRTEAEKTVWQKFAKGDLLIKLLPVLDTIEVAQKHLKDKGLEIAISQFGDILKGEGIEEISGGKFDESVHEAIDLVEGGEPETIAEILVKGYKFKDGEIIRPARVIVYKGQAEDSARQGK